MKKKFATAINCMDGRTQEPIIKWIKEYFKVDFVDMITEPGPVAKLSENKQDCSFVKSIVDRVSISTKLHFSKSITIVAHAGCAGNPIEDEQQKKQIIQCVEVVKQWALAFQIVGLWVNADQTIEEIIV